MTFLCTLGGVNRIKARVGSTFILLRLQNSNLSKKLDETPKKISAGWFFKNSKTEFDGGNFGRMYIFILPLFLCSVFIKPIEIVVTPWERMFSWAGLGRLWKNTDRTVYHDGFDGSLLVSKYNKFKPSCKTALLWYSCHFFCQNGPKAYSRSRYVQSLCSHLSGFYWGHQCSWALTSDNRIKVSII